MKKATKICIITAGIAAVVGIIFLSAGMAMGAKPEEFLQVQIGWNGIDIGGSQAIWAGWDDSLEDEGGKTIAGKDIDRLILQVGSGEVKIYLSENTDEITCYSNRDQSIYKVEDNSLIIVEDRVKEPLHLEIYLPGKIWKEVELNLGACSAYIEGIRAEDISIELGAGEVKADSLYYADTADLKVGAGALNVSSCEGKQLRLECGIGSMNVILAGREADYNYQLECGVGTISLQEKEFSGMGWENSVNNQAAKQVNAECGMGEITIAFLGAE